MQKWEYLRLSVSMKEKEVVTRIFANGEELQPTNKNTKFSELLNWYGAQGWELVAYDGGTCFFKRATP